MTISATTRVYDDGYTREKHNHCKSMKGMDLPLQKGADEKIQIPNSRQDFT